MAISLYHPQGFFGGDVLRSDKGGDFLTSPEVSSLFGETLASHVEAERGRIGEPFNVVEVGAGSGSLLESLLAAIDVPVQAIEASPAARSSLEQKLGADRVFANLEELSRPLRGVVLANELLDNLPMAVAQRIGGEWRERWVGLDGDDLTFVDAAARPEVSDWLDRFAGPVEEGGWVEAQMAAGEWLSSVIGILSAGSIVVIDYGDTAEGLAPRRQDGTLRTYRAHHLGPHPLDEPGETDITADVNFTALVAVSEREGAVAKLHRQDDFLSELGLRERLSSLRREELEAARSGDTMEQMRVRSMRTEAETLLHPRGLGDFRVLVVEV